MHIYYTYVTGHTGTLGELVGSHTKVAIYPPTQSAVEGCDPACCNTGFEGIKVVNYLAN